MATTSGRLSGMTAVVTGGASGIGAAICRRFAEEGCRVAIADLQADRAASVAKELTAFGPAATFGALDTSCPDEVASFVRDVDERFGHIDVLVNNAGWVKVSPTLALAVEDFDRMLAVYLRGLLVVPRHVIPSMLRRGSGSIVNIASMQAYRALPGRSGVQAAKGGITALSRELALEFGPANIRVNCVLPGFTITEKVQVDYAATATEEELALRRDCYPLRRFGSPQDIANAVLFLASTEASWITGVDLTVDGGISIELAEALMFPPFRRLWQESVPNA